MGDATTRARTTTTTTWTWGFALYAAISLVHVIFLALGPPEVAGATKLLLMPALALAVLWGGRGTSWGPAVSLLLVAIALSWLGDGAATFFPMLPELPVMLACFGLAHVAYIWLFVRVVPTRPLPRWTLVYAVWWVVLLAVLWPWLGSLAIAVALYGLILGGTAATAARVSPLTAVGAAAFLASDSLLAFRLFVPETPAPVGVAVMVTYTLGQGLIAAGVLRVLRERDR